jgi:hypothetical protein
MFFVAENGANILLLTGPTRCWHHPLSTSATRACPMIADLEIRAAELNARLDALRAPVFCRAGKRALRWFRRYDHDLSGERSGYGISRAEASRHLRRLGLSVA